MKIVFSITNLIFNKKWFYYLFKNATARMQRETSIRCKNGMDWMMKIRINPIIAMNSNIPNNKLIDYYWWIVCIHNNT